MPDDEPTLCRHGRSICEECNPVDYWRFCSAEHEELAHTVMIQANKYSQLHRHQSQEARRYQAELSTLKARYDILQADYAELIAEVLTLRNRRESLDGAGALANPEE